MEVLDTDEIVLLMVKSFDMVVWKPTIPMPAFNGSVFRSSGG